MGLIKKIRIRRAGARQERPKQLSAPKTDAAVKESMSYSVLAVPKAYSQESQSRFNWMTNEVDSFEHDISRGESATRANNCIIAKPQHELCVSDLGWGEWLFSCFGSPAVVKFDEPTVQLTMASTCTSDDGSEESSVPSCSREGQVLKVKRNSRSIDDVSDITSVPSEDGSESDESEDSYFQEDKVSRKKSVWLEGM